MEFAAHLLDLFLHVDKHLAELVRAYGLGTYVILFLIVFLETGIPISPLLPGDSLLFAAGAVASTGALSPFWLFVLLGLAAILGDTVNYWIGAAVGPHAFGGRVRFLKKEHLDRTHRFYQKHGGKTIVLARFIPVIRKLAPFVAGIGAMSYGRFVFFNILGGVLWTALFIFGGYYFGTLPVVQENFGLVIVAIIVISLAPVLREWIQHRRRKNLPADAS